MRKPLVGKKKGSRLEWGGEIPVLLWTQEEPRREAPQKRRKNQDQKRTTGKINNEHGVEEKEWPVS